ncbi:hypothetical protein GCM10022423_46020 [Flavobacterium ginsengiterrae]|uniref:Uncharacterized protein n=1 Tax=Flavobacterium ginsengiterrae TaxID=871695 RepID=A0ABP7H6Q5_9FLAO
MVETIDYVFLPLQKRDYLKTRSQPFSAPAEQNIYRISIKQIKKAPAERHIFTIICRSAGALCLNLYFLAINILL